MRSIFLFFLLTLAACGADWRATAQTEAEDLVRLTMHDPTLQFSRVKFTGDQQSGQTCGYYERSNVFGGKDSTRFIVFIDGAGGKNPYIDNPSAPYPESKSDFDVNWQTQCLDLGYAA